MRSEIVGIGKRKGDGVMLAPGFSIQFIKKRTRKLAYTQNHHCCDCAESISLNHISMIGFHLE